MYKLFKEINNINGFIVDKSNLILGDKLKNLSLPNNQIVSNVDTSQPSLQRLENLLVFNSEGKAGFYNFENEEIFILEPQSNFYPFLLKDQLLFSYDFQFNNNSYTWKTGLLDIISKNINEIVFLNSVPILFSNFEIQIASENGFLKLYKTLENTFLWQTSLESYGTFRKVLGVCGENLWVILDGTRYLGLEIHSGKVVHDFYPIKECIREEGFEMLNPHFDESACKVYYLQRQHYVCIDLIKLSSSVLWHTEEEIQIHRSSITEDFIYFTASPIKYGVADTMLGIFDRKNKKIVQTIQENFQDQWTFFKEAPQYANGKIYALDTAGTLRIYEKTN
jgi:hypothetical protein